MPGRRAARRTGRRAARRTTRRRAVVAPVPRRAAVPRGRRRRPLLAIAAMGGVAAVAYKMGKGNAQKVEEYTGKPVDTLTDEELAAAMEDLNIELPEDEAASAAVDDGYIDDALAEQPDYLAELEGLAVLRDQGVITEEEFQAKKKQLLGL